MRFAWRTATTGNFEIPEGARPEAALAFLNGIVNKFEEFQIPPSLILNIDQINSKYVSLDREAMTEKDSTSVPIGGLSDERSITVTFTITLNGIFHTATYLWWKNCSKFT